MVEAIGHVLGFFAAYGLQALLFFALAFAIVVPGLGLLLAIRAGWRRISPYQPPAFGAVPSFRDRLEHL